MNPSEAFGESEKVVQTLSDWRTAYMDGAYTAYNQRECSEALRLMDATLKQPITLEDLRARRNEILTIARRCRAFNVRVFGSVARGSATPNSDVDFLVSFEPGATLMHHSGLRLDLIDLLGVNVDVISDHPGLTPAFRQRVEREAVSL